MFHTSLFKPSFNAFILMAGLRLYSACIVHIQAGFFDRHKKPLIFQTDHSKIEMLYSDMLNLKGGQSNRDIGLIL